MPSATPNLHHLELFYHVAKAGGITAAVRSMTYGIQQPALSGQIAALETEMGIRLFQRRPFQLTPAGRELYGFLAPFFGRLPEIAAQIAGKASSHLRLAAPATAGKKHLPAVISAMRKRRPDLEVTLREAGHREVMELLEREEVDLAISEIDGPVPPGIQQAILASLPLVLLLPPGAPAQDLAVLVKSWPLIRPSATTAVARLFAKGMAKHALHWPSRMEVSTIELVDAYVAQGLGAGVTVRVPGVRFSRNIGVVDLPDFPELVIAGLWRGKLHPLAEEVIARLRQIAGAAEPAQPP